MSELEELERAANERPGLPAKRTAAADKKYEGFTDEKRGAMKERAQELKAAGRRGPRGKNADEEGAVLAKIAEMPGSDRAMAERLHALPMLCRWPRGCIRGVRRTRRS